MGFTVTKDRAVQAAQDIFAIRQKLLFPINRRATHPPTDMWPAHAFSRADMWRLLWGPKSMFSMIEESPNFPMSTIFGLWHGTEDSNVPFGQSLAVGHLFCRKGSPGVTVYLEEGKPHAWDYNEPLSPEKRDFLTKRESTISSDLKIVHLQEFKN